MERLLSAIMLLDIDSLYFGKFDHCIHKKGEKLEQYNEAAKIYKFLAENGIYHPETEFSSHINNYEEITLQGKFPDLKDFGEEEENVLEERIRSIIRKTKRLCKLNQIGSDMHIPEHYIIDKNGEVYYDHLAVFPLHPKYLKRYQIRKEFTRSANSALVLKK